MALFVPLVNTNLFLNHVNNGLTVCILIVWHTYISISIKLNSLSKLTLNTSGKNSNIVYHGGLYGLQIITCTK